MNVSLREIAEMVQGTVIGDDKMIIDTLSPIDNISPGSLVFAEGKENIKIAEQSLAAVMLVDRNTTSMCKNIIQVAHPFKAFIQLLHHFYPRNQAKPGIHPTAVIAEDVKLGQNIAIGAGVVIESGASIGDGCVIKSHVHIGCNSTVGANTTLHPHVTIYDHCHLGQRVCIHASTVIGSDGFGYMSVDGEHIKVPHPGQVIIEDDVEIGANTVIDRATLGATVIGQGTKIDNLVQIAHSVRLGKNNILCAFTGIAGSTRSGDNVTFAANVGVSDHVLIDNNVILAARAGVPPKKHLLEGNIYLGNPARPRDKAIEQELSVTRIPIMRKNLKALSEKVSQLSEKMASLQVEE